jgi:hypothetical protein
MVAEGVEAKEAAEHLAVLNTWAGSMVQKRTG